MSRKIKNTTVLEKLNHTSMTQAPLVVLDHSRLWKKLLADKRHISFFFFFFYLLGSETIEVMEEAALGGFQSFQKRFSKGVRSRLRGKREIENVVMLKDHHDLTVSARETESKVQRSLTSNVFHSSDLQFTIWEISINV